MSYVDEWLANDFVHMFGDGMTLNHLMPALSCGEVGTFVEMLEACGADAETLEYALTAHALDDDADDLESHTDDQRIDWAQVFDLGWREVDEQ